MTFSYSVAIRTLGKAGEKYLETLRSLAAQTVPPTSIYIYIPHGYDLPEYSICVEKYIRCKKGMVAQRALSFSEIEDEWILFLDDDVFLPSDYMHRAKQFIESNNCDMLTANFYNEEKASLIEKIKKIFQFVFPMRSTSWAYKINAAGRFTYNLSPQEFMLTQTGPGACMLCRKCVYERSRFHEERWMDDLGYALGDDQLFHYKMYLQGAKLYIWTNSGALHLDAGSGNRKFDYATIRKITCALFLVWHRSIFRRKNFRVYRKVLAVVAFMSSFILRFLYSFIYLFRGMWRTPFYICLGLCDAIKSTLDKSYSSLPYFDEI